MDLNDRQNENVARFLDGEKVELTAAERTAADEILRMEIGLGEELAAQPSREATQRARRRMRAALARPRRRQWVGAVAVAAAAVILIAVAVTQFISPPAVSPETKLDVDVLADVYLEADQSADLDVLAEEIAQLEADMVSSLSTQRAQSELDELEQNMETFWLEEPFGWIDEG